MLFIVCELYSHAFLGGRRKGRIIAMTLGVTHTLCSVFSVSTSWWAAFLAYYYLYWSELLSWMRLEKQVKLTMKIVKLTVQNYYFNSQIILKLMFFHQLCRFVCFGSYLLMIIAYTFVGWWGSTWSMIQFRLCWGVLASSMYMQSFCSPCSCLG